MDGEMKVKSVVVPHCTILISQVRVACCMSDGFVVAVAASGAGAIESVAVPNRAVLISHICATVSPMAPFLLLLLPMLAQGETALEIAAVRGHMTVVNVLK